MKIYDRSGEGGDLLRKFDELRKAAHNGAAGVLGSSRWADVEDLVSEALNKYLVSKIPILDHRAWAYTLARNSAIALLKREQPLVSLAEELAGSDEDGRARTREDVIGRFEDADFGWKPELVEKLPELFDLLYESVLNSLSTEDQKFLKLRLIEENDDVQLAEAYGITPKSARRRWQRLLAKARRSLVREMHSWPEGQEMFQNALKDKKDLNALLCLACLYAREGLQAVRALVNSFNTCD